MQHHNFTVGGFIKICVGIDVAKDKHDCFILNSKSVVLADVFTLLFEFPGAKQIAAAHQTRLKTLLADASRGRCGRDAAVEIRDIARCSIGSTMPAKSLEL